MDEHTKQGMENLEKTAEAADLVTIPEGAKEYVDLIGDEDLDSFGNPGSNADRR